MFLPQWRHAVARRSVAQAQAWFDDWSPNLTPDARRQAQDEINEARSRAQNFAAGVVEGHTQRVDSQRDDLLRELCAIRDEYASVAKAGQDGLLTAAEYTERLNDLDSRLDSCTKKASAAAKAAEAVAEIEEDPLAYADDYFSRNRNIQHDFSF